MMDEKRHAIMQTAERLFTHRRIHEITLDEVARKARVGKGTIYRHFRDKDDLFFQVATSGFDELCDLVRERVPEHAPFEEQLKHMCVQISGYFESRCEMFRMMQAEDARMPGCKETLQQRWLTHRRKLVSVVAEVISRGVAAGVVRSDIPPEILGDLLLGMLRTRVRDLRNVPESLRRYEVLVDLFCNGVVHLSSKSAASRPRSTRKSHVRPPTGAR
jgi:AcrR family transcriptional regulator